MASTSTADISYWGAIWVPLIAAFVGALVGGLLSILASREAVRLSLAKLESEELRRRRVNCLVDIVAHKYVLGTSKTDSAEAVALFVALNAIPALFANERSVMDAYRTFRDAARRREAANRQLIDLIKVIDQKIDFGMGLLTDDDFEIVLR